MKKVIFSLLLIILIALFFIFFNKEITGRVIEDVIEKNSSFLVSKIVFEGEDGKEIYGLFFKPFKDKFDVIVVLPAAAGTKESRRFYGEILTEIGYGVVILDQRGIGETDGNVPSLQDDFQNFVEGKESFQVLTAKDVIRVVDFLEGSLEVDEVGVLGESMGGRNAIIAAGLDARIKIAVVISSAGYFTNFDDARVNEFLSHINPNSYIGKIRGRLLMLHSVFDNVISIDDARKTFSLAREPKRFVEINYAGCVHGYCKEMLQAIEDELRTSFGD